MVYTYIRPKIVVLSPFNIHNSSPPASPKLFSFHMLFCVFVHILFLQLQFFLIVSFSWGDSPTRFFSLLFFMKLLFLVLIDMPKCYFKFCRIFMELHMQILNTEKLALGNPYYWHLLNLPPHVQLTLYFYVPLKEVCHEIFRVLFWHVWIDLGLYKNLWLFWISSVEPLIYINV